MNVNVGANISTRVGVLHVKNGKANSNANDVGDFELDVSSAGKMYKYACIIVSMFSPDAWRQFYYIEGSAYVQFETIEATDE